MQHIEHHDGPPARLKECKRCRSAVVQALGQQGAPERGMSAARLNGMMLFEHKVAPEHLQLCEDGAPQWRMPCSR
ncbi:hypothetical protein EYF80_012808 [Liparis tanakae]|uniref:Uncharacterized protein n=1 Tax=Liparis tanakae TaxID=230148 RepID=A0A4Z2II12_9TELE|nr:hypothetical protein EYF80_012808 [Liparis tanakae]